MPRQVQTTTIQTPYCQNHLAASLNSDAGSDVALGLKPSGFTGENSWSRIQSAQQWRYSR